MKLLAALGGEQQLLPHFLRHYEALGVTQFFLAVRHGTTLPPLPTNVHVSISYAGKHDMFRDTLALREIQARVIGLDEWFLVLDGDEFVRFPVPITKILAMANELECIWVCGRLIDRIAADGSLPPIFPDSDLESLFPQRVALTPFLGGPMQKAVLVKGQTELTPGHHYSVGRVLDVAVEIDHYKWHAGVVERLRERVDEYQRIGYDWWVQSAAFLNHFREHGKIDLTKVHPLMV